MKSFRVVIITGLSGSGKSTALRALEDIGFFCVDNLPVVLLPKFLDITIQSSPGIDRVAMVMDLREKSFLAKYRRIFQKMKEKGFKIEIIFLEASNEALLHRFSETRRNHPLAARGPVMDGIVLEKEKLFSLRKMADRIIDTTAINVHQLKDIVQRQFYPVKNFKKMVIGITSFAYRYGLPADADLVFDVRFLPNPYFVENLKNYDGHNSAVKKYVFKNRESKKILRQMLDLLKTLIPLYDKEGKARLNIAVGCTGGKHRSVVMANELALRLTNMKYLINSNHRDVAKS